MSEPTDIARLRELKQASIPNPEKYVECPNTDCAGRGEYRVWAQGKYRTGYMPCPDCKKTLRVRETHDHPALKKDWRAKRRKYENAIIEVAPALLDELDRLEGVLGEATDLMAQRWQSTCAGKHPKDMKCNYCLFFEKHPDFLTKHKLGEKK